MVSPPPSLRMRPEGISHDSLVLLESTIDYNIIIPVRALWSVINFHSSVVGDSVWVK